MKFSPETIITKGKIEAKQKRHQIKQKAKGGNRKLFNFLHKFTIDKKSHNFPSGKKKSGGKCC